jgi:PTH1 family peptidyl-tRNA hydrolase
MKPAIPARVKVTGLIPNTNKITAMIANSMVKKISNKCNIDVAHSKYKGIYGMGEINEEKVLLLKPQTYMNLSGECIIKFKNFYKIPNNKIITIYDDMDLNVGDIRIRKSGGPGTHNGMKSVIENLNTTDFYRIRIGVGMPEEKEKMINYLIEKITKQEFEKLDNSLSKGAEAVLEIIKNGIDSAMNKFN